jgi:hypothetical protein
MRSLAHQPAIERGGTPDPRPSDTTTPPPQRVLAALRARGTTARRWALAHGYRPRTVYAAIRDWVGRTDRAPLGGIKREIVRELRAELGAELVPEHREAA